MNRLNNLRYHMLNKWNNKDSNKKFEDHHNIFKGKYHNKLIEVILIRSLLYQGRHRHLHRHHH